MKKIGVIGLGIRVRGLLKLMSKAHGDAVEVSCVADIRPAEEIVNEIDEAGFGRNVVLYSDWKKMLDECHLDGVMIGTRCNLHAEIAVEVLKRNINLFLEKPVSINESQLEALDNARRNTSAKVVVSFPLRMTSIVRKVKELIDAGEIGEIMHSNLFNYVPYGGVYFQNWYRDESITGGLFLQKATHDLDYLFSFCNKKPVEICAVKSKNIFVGNHPAGLKCKDCAEQETCPQGPVVLKSQSECPQGEYCAFAVDTGNEDSGSCIIKFEDGSHAVYTQNFFIKKGSARRGAFITGYKGGIEFDFYKQTIRLTKHDADMAIEYNFALDGSTHWGGDAGLLDSFINIMNGGETESSLYDGVKSAAVCLAAKKSALTSTFVKVEI